MKPRNEPHKLLQSVRIQAIANTGALDLSLDHTRLFQNTQVLPNGGLSNRQLVDKIAAHARPIPKDLHDLNPDWVGQCFGDAGELLSLVHLDILSCSLFVE
jgi:hypothetical protein